MEEKELTHEITASTKKVSEIVVTDQASFQVASNAIIDLDKIIKRIKEYWSDPKKKSYDSWKAICNKENEMVGVVELKRKEINGKIRSFLTEQERQRRIEQEKLDAERRAQEEKERAKLAKAAEKAEEKGKIEKAEELREKAENVFIAPAIVQPEVEKTTRTDTGTVSTVKDIEIEITDIKEVLKQIVDGKIPTAVVTISESKLKAHIKSWGIDKMSGVIIREVINARFRGSK